MKQPLIDLKVQYREIESEINAAINNVLERADFIFGKDVGEFEGACAEYLGVKYSIGVASGTDALIIALEACGLKKGDEVITTPFTFIASAEAIHKAGGKAVFVDINDSDCNINCKLIKKAIKSKTKAILPVHLFGSPAGMDEIRALADKNGLFIVEDCAQSMGALYKGKKAGSIGRAGAFSFFPGKNLGAFGDGGLIATDDLKVMEEARVLRNHGASGRYSHRIPGYNSRLDTIQAAVLKVKLKYLDDWNEKRRAIAKKYDREIGKMGYGTLKPNGDSISSMNYYSFRTGGKRNELQGHLGKSGIASKVYYPLPLHLQEAFSALGYKKGDFPVTERISEEIISLPMYPELTDEQIENILKVIRSM